jgi:hypothetical protein
MGSAGIDFTHTCAAAGVSDGLSIGLGSTRARLGRNGLVEVAPDGRRHRAGRLLERYDAFFFAAVQASVLEGHRRLHRQGRHHQLPELHVLVGFGQAPGPWVGETIPRAHY